MEMGILHRSLIGNLASSSGFFVQLAEINGLSDQKLHAALEREQTCGEGDSRVVLATYRPYLSPAVIYIARLCRSEKEARQKGR